MAPPVLRQSQRIRQMGNLGLGSKRRNRSESGEDDGHNSSGTQATPPTPKKPNTNTPTSSSNSSKNMVELHPSDTLVFSGGSGGKIANSKLKVVNISDKWINYKTKVNATAAKFFAMQPNNGSLAPGASTYLLASLKVSNDGEPTPFEFLFLADSLEESPQSNRVNSIFMGNSVSWERHSLKCVYMQCHDDTYSHKEDDTASSTSSKRGETNESNDKSSQNKRSTSQAKSPTSFCNSQNLAEATNLYKKSQVASGISRPVKRSYLEKAIRLYGQELKKTNQSDQMATISRNLGMSNYRLADVVDAIDPDSEVKLVSYYLKEAVIAFTQALIYRQDDISTEWGIGIRDRIMDSFDLGFRRTASRVVENERVRSSQLDKLIDAIPSIQLFDSLRGRCYLAKAQYYHRRSVVAQEENNIVAAVQKIEYSNEETQLAIQFASADPLLQSEIRVMEEEINAGRCTCESLRARNMGDKLLEHQLKNEEGINMGIMWTILDKFKEAVLLTREMDVENEAIALTRMGRMFEAIFKMRIKAHTAYRRAFDLTATLLPRDLSKFDWFKETKDALERFQRIIVLEEQKREDEEKAPILKKLEAELKILSSMACISNSIPEFLKFVYEKYPPKIAHKFDAAAMEDMDRNATKAALKEAITHYHPDRQSKFGLEWKVLCGEVTKHLTFRYESYK